MVFLGLIHAFKNNGFLPRSLFLRDGVLFCKNVAAFLKFDAQAKLFSSGGLKAD